MINMFLPLFPFFPQLKIKGPDGTTANIVRADYACGSILYTIDAPLAIPELRNDSDALNIKAAEVLTSTIPVYRPLACAEGNGVSYEYDAYNSPIGTVPPIYNGGNATPSGDSTDGGDGTDGLSAGAIAGIAVGVTAVVVGVLCCRLPSKTPPQTTAPATQGDVGHDR